MLGFCLFYFFAFFQMYTWQYVATGRGLALAEGELQGRELHEVNSWFCPVVPRPCRALTRGRPSQGETLF